MASERSEADELLRQSTRFLGGHGRAAPREVLAALAEWAADLPEGDRYGVGTLIEGFEAEVAALLGKPAAVFMPSGTMAQQIALRLWAEQRGHRFVAFHPTSHLEIHEHQAVRLLHGLHGVLVGSPHQLMTLDELQTVTDPLAALLLELPQREIGGQLPTWEALTAIVGWARERAIALHLDGARLWECGPFYGRPYAEIAALFDSVYVSFYKGLGGLAGAMLLGPEAFVAAARTWLRRHGGNLVQLYPYVLSAQKGLRERLERMGRYHDKAVEVAAALARFPQLSIVPDPPQTNMMHLYLRGDRARLERAILHTTRESGVWLFHPLRPSPLPGAHKVELWVGDATLALPTEEIVALFATFLQRAEA